MMEAAAGYPDTARLLFERACRQDPEMPHTYTAWARLVASQGNADGARKLFQAGAHARPGHAPLLHVSEARPLCLLVGEWVVAVA